MIHSFIKMLLTKLILRYKIKTQKYYIITVKKLKKIMIMGINFPQYLHQKIRRRTLNLGSLGIKDYEYSTNKRIVELK